VKYLLDCEPDRTVNLFGAMFDYSWGRYAFMRSARLRRRMAIISEASDPDGWRFLFRLLKHIFIRILFEKRIQFVFAMGQFGIQWFRRCGYPSKKLFPFGYFIDPQVEKRLLTKIDNTNKEIFTLIFVGSLVKRKNVDIILNALALLPKNSFYLQIVGDGPERAFLQDLANKLNIAQSIIWYGVLPCQESRAIISQADLLILPSRMDGWGVVINEALMNGTPVVCSDFCGAKDLLMERWRGEIFHRNDTKELAKILLQLVESGKVTKKQRNKIKKWSELITGKSAATYLISVISHVYGSYENKPSPSWLTN
jgi:glycosyltransferase involved in cell wall biosynthesis